MSSEAEIMHPKSSGAFVNRELSWLQFARRVLAMAEDERTPLLERVKFLGIVGMLHDEFFMKRISGLKRQITQGVEKLSIDGLRPQEELAACRKEVLAQEGKMHRLLEQELRPGLLEIGLPIFSWEELEEGQQEELRAYFQRSVLPILTPLAVDAQHPFPFIAGLSLNLAATLKKGKKRRFVCLRVPANRKRWVRVEGGRGRVPLEQVVAANLDLLFPNAESVLVSFFRVTRGAEGRSQTREDLEDGEIPTVPGSMIAMVTDELRARKFAGEVRLEVSANMPDSLRAWVGEQLELAEDDIYEVGSLPALCDLLSFRPEGFAEYEDPEFRPRTHPRLRGLKGNAPSGIFEAICRGEILVHHPYDSFETSVLAFIEAAATDPAVLAIKLTIYRTSADSPIIRSLVEASRSGKEVAVVVEITARFDEAPNIRWCRYLEKEGVHVAYGVDKLKTHVKAALVLREEAMGIRRYVHVGTGNYHSGTAKIYEDLGIFSCDLDLCSDVSDIFNELTSVVAAINARKLLVAPYTMRSRFTELIRREALHASEGKPASICAKMNQLQDPSIIRELYRASIAGVQIDLIIRGLCSLRPLVPGLSENIRVISILGRFLEHGRIYRFENDGSSEYFLGSADWMKRNLDRRVEIVMPVESVELQGELDAILRVYLEDNASAWEMLADGSYRQRRPAEGEERRAAQDIFIQEVSRS